MSLRISADTTVGALLEAFPQAEAVLLGMAPAFAKLRNPVIRRTVAKVATLDQAAKIGQVSLREMIQRLCECTGQCVPGSPAESAPAASSAEESWLVKAQIHEEVDADAMLETGVHPIGRIRETVEALKPGQAVLLRSSFRPEPLIDLMRRAGVAVCCVEHGSRFSTYFGRRG